MNTHPWQLRFLIQFLLYAFFIGNTVLFMFSPIYLQLFIRFQSSENQILDLTRIDQSKQILYSIYPLVDLEYQLQSLDLNSREIIHLKDVKTIFSRFLAGYFAVLLLLKYTVSRLPLSTHRHLWTNSLLSVLIISGSMLFILVSAIVFAWNQLFTLFHQLLFTEGSWLFYEDDVLIILFPETFWLVSALILIIFPILQAGVSFILATGYITFSWKFTSLK